MWCYCFSPKVAFIFKDVSTVGGCATSQYPLNTHVHKPLHSFIGVFSDRMLLSAAGAA